MLRNVCLHLEGGLSLVMMDPGGLADGRYQGKGGVWTWTNRDAKTLALAVGATKTSRSRGGPGDDRCPPWWTDLCISRRRTVIRPTSFTDVPLAKP